MYRSQLPSVQPTRGFSTLTFRQKIATNVMRLKQTSTPPTPLISQRIGRSPEARMTRNCMLLKMRLNAKMFESLIKLSKTSSSQMIVPKMVLSLGSHFLTLKPTAANKRNIARGRMRQARIQFCISQVSCRSMSTGGMISKPIYSSRQRVVTMLLRNMQSIQTWINSMSILPISVKALKKYAPIRIKIPSAVGKFSSTPIFQACRVKLLRERLPSPTASGLLNIKSYIYNPDVGVIFSALACNIKRLLSVWLVRNVYGILWMLLQSN